MMIDSITQNLRAIIGQIDEATQMAKNIADEFFGPQPEKELLEETPNPSTVATVMHLESRVRVLLNQLNRFSEQRSEQRGPTLQRETQGNRRFYGPPPSTDVESAIASLVRRDIGGNAGQ